jgi:hypothetical protein
MAYELVEDLAARIGVCTGDSAVNLVLSWRLSKASLVADV